MTRSNGALLLASGEVSPKRDHILNAAEICFVRSGFDRATMQDIAREAAMSPANIYRYFSSKEDVVLGLAERDREQGAVLLKEIEQSGDQRGVLLGVIEHFFVRLSREAAILRLGLWSEATRHPGIAAMVAHGEEEARIWFVGMLSALAKSPACEPASVYAALNPLMKGVIVNRALIADYDPAAAMAHLIAQIDRGLAGRLAVSLEDAEGAR